MIIIEKEQESIFLNDRIILDCRFNRKTGKVKVLTPKTSIEYTDAVAVSYIPDGNQDQTVTYDKETY